MKYCNLNEYFFHVYRDSIIIVWLGFICSLSSLYNKYITYYKWLHFDFIVRVCCKKKTLKTLPVYCLWPVTGIRWSMATTLTNLKKKSSDPFKVHDTINTTVTSNLLSGADDEDFRSSGRIILCRYIVVYSCYPQGHRLIL